VSPSRSARAHRLAHRRRHRAESDDEGADQQLTAQLPHFEGQLVDAPRREKCVRSRSPVPPLDEGLQGELHSQQVHSGQEQGRQSLHGAFSGGGGLPRYCDYEDKL
jgi:hypothetical protein